MDPFDYDLPDDDFVMVVVPVPSARPNGVAKTDQSSAPKTSVAPKTTRQAATTITPMLSSTHLTDFAMGNGARKVHYGGVVIAKNDGKPDRRAPAVKQNSQTDGPALESAETKDPIMKSALGNKEPANFQTAKGPESSTLLPEHAEQLNEAHSTEAASEAKNLINKTMTKASATSPSLFAESHQDEYDPVPSKRLSLPPSFIEQWMKKEMEKKSRKSNPTNGRKTGRAYIEGIDAKSLTDGTGQMIVEAAKDLGDTKVNPNIRTDARQA